MKFQMLCRFGFFRLTLATKIGGDQFDTRALMTLTASWLDTRDLMTLSAAWLALRTLMPQIDVMFMIIVPANRKRCSHSLDA